MANNGFFLSTSLYCCIVMVVNVLAAACGGTDTGGVEPDTTPPVVVRTEPADGASGVANDVKIKVWFDEAVDNKKGGWDDLLHLRKPDGTNLYGNSSYDLEQHVVSLNMSIDLMAGQTYTAVLEKGICDLAGNCMGEGLTWTFTIAQ